MIKNQDFEEKIKFLEHDNNELMLKYENMKNCELNNLNIISKFEKNFEIKNEELNNALKDCVKYENEIKEEREKTKRFDEII